MAMPAAKGLFHRHLPERRGGPPAHCKGAGGRRRVLPVRKQSDPSQLKRCKLAPASRVIAAGERVDRASASYSTAVLLSPASVRDLPTAPLDAIAAGSARVPLIVGCHKYEARLQLAAKVLIEAVTESNCRLLGAFAWARSTPTSSPDTKPIIRPRRLAIYSCVPVDRTRMASIALAEAHIKGGGPAT